MPTITKISPQKKRQGYYNIYIDGKYSLALSELDLATFGLSIDQFINDSYLLELKNAQTQAKSYYFALSYLALRPRSILEVKNYLITRRAISPTDTDKTISRLLSEKYLDDNAFAEMWVRNRTLLSPKSLPILRMELASKGIDKDIINDVLLSINEDSQLRLLSSVIEKKFRQTKYQDQKKLIAYLSRQGFSYHLVKKAFERLALFENKP